MLITARWKKRRKSWRVQRGRERKAEREKGKEGRVGGSSERRMIKGEDLIS